MTNKTVWLLLLPLVIMISLSLIFQRPLVSAQEGESNSTQDDYWKFFKEPVQASPLQYVVADQIIEPTVIDSGVIPISQPIPDGDVDGMRVSFTITKPLWIEAVSIYYNINHPQLDDLEVWLVSPNNTATKLVVTPIREISQNEVNYYSTAIHDGEIAKGEWQLRIIDRQLGNIGELSAWQLIVSGKPIDTTYIPSIMSVPIIIDPGPVTPVTAIPTDTPTNTGTPTNTPTITETPTPATPTETPIPATPTNTLPPTLTPTITNTPTPRDTETPIPTFTPGSATNTPTPRPFVPTATPTPVCKLRGIDNAGFENGRNNWKRYSLLGKEELTIMSVNDRPIELPIEPVDGDWVAWLGGLDLEINSISQDGIELTSSCQYIAHDILVQSYEDDAGCVMQRYPFEKFDPRYNDPFFQYDPTNPSDSNFLFLLNYLRLAQPNTIYWNREIDVMGIIVRHTQPNGDKITGVGIIESDVFADWSLCNQAGGSDWGEVIYDTSYFAGKTVSIEFKIVTNGATRGDGERTTSSVFIDNVRASENPFGDGRNGRNHASKVPIIDIKILEPGSPEYEFWTQ